MNWSHFRGRIPILTVTSALLLVWFLAFFGSPDIEESVNSAFSAGIRNERPESTQDETGVYSAFGVPIYDRLQGTGDRMPYQASWAQSITWPLRFFAGWESYALLRTLLFALPSIFVGMLTLQSWRPQLPDWVYVVTAIVTNSSIGVYMRWNDWSDHYVQTLGVCSVCFLLMHRWFHDVSEELTPPPKRAVLLCLFIGTQGVLTGHPGFWPIAVVVPVAICLGFLSSPVFRQRVSDWVRPEARLAGAALVVLLFTFLVITFDLLGELEGQVWGERRLSRTQGLFSEYAFQGVYGLRVDGFLPDPIRRSLSVLLATTVMPVFILFDTWLPQVVRATAYAELTRLEFSGSLVFLLLIGRMNRGLPPTLRALLLRMAFSQVAIWIFVIASTLDALPTFLAPSGAWLVLPVVLALNGMLSVILLVASAGRVRYRRAVAGLNLSLILIWSLFQFGALSMGTGLRIPERVPTWYGDREEVAQLFLSDEGSLETTRVMLAASLARRPLANLISLGVPVVSPADPKIRTQDHLVDGFAFNYSIDPPSLWKMYDDDADRLLDFLQITDFVVQRRAEGQFIYSHLASLLDRYPNRSVVEIPNRWGKGKVDSLEVEVLRRNRFSAFVIDRDTAREIGVCPNLKQTCQLLRSSTRLETDSQPKLRRCIQDCLWQFDAPGLTADEVLILPITFDSALAVRGAKGETLNTLNVGGFLGTYSDAGTSKARLAVTLNPDARMIGRVLASYLGLLMFLVMVAHVVASGRQTPWRRNGAGIKNRATNPPR